MGRKKQLLILPELKDFGGDISKKWFVEYSVRNPRTDKLERIRTYEGFSKLKTAKERYSYAEKIIKQIKDQLEKGIMPFDKKEITYQDEIIYYNAARRWGNEHKGIITIRTYLSEFLLEKKASVTKKSYLTYQSKCRIFCEWAEQKGIADKHVSNITQETICEYLTYLVTEHQLSKLTIFRYGQILHNFFDFLIKKKKIMFDNPAQNLPRIGLVKDHAPRPIPDTPRRILINSIMAEDEQLFLFCQFEYYCAIRPNELRHLKISDIDFDRRIIRVRNEISKNSKTEIVKMPTQLYLCLTELNYHQWPNKEDYIFSRDHRPGPYILGINNIRNRFNKIRKRLGLSTFYKLYSFKHTGSSKLVDAGVSPWELQQHMRHKSITTTEEYIKNKCGVSSDQIENHFPDL